MAFASKLCSLLKKTTSANPSLFQAIRCMSSSKLFVGGLSYNVDEHSFREEFGNYGTVVEAKIILDRETGRSRGFGFVTYSSPEEASAAITAMDGKDLQGRSIRVNHATERTGGFRSGDGGFGSGGYGSGGGGVGGYGSGGGGVGGYGSGGGGYSNNFDNSGGGFGGGGDYGVTGGAGGGFTAGGGDNFAGSNFSADSGFGGNPAGGFGAAGGDEFPTGAPGDNSSSGKNDDIMGDLFKDDEPDNFANKRG